jgi:ArsR family transcriptional regulator
MDDKRRRAAATRAVQRRNVEKLALVAKALSHPARVEIVQLLQERQTCVGCDIVDEVGLAQSTTSEHLRVLKAADVIVGEIERPRVCYSLNPEALEPLHAFLGELLDDSRGVPIRGPIRSVAPPAKAARRGRSSEEA